MSHLQFGKLELEVPIKNAMHEINAKITKSAEKMKSKTIKLSPAKNVQNEQKVKFMVKKDQSFHQGSLEKRTLH